MFDAENVSARSYVRHVRFKRIPAGLAPKLLLLTSSRPNSFQNTEKCNTPYRKNIHKLLHGKVDPSVLIGSFLVGISPYEPFPWKRS